MVTSKQAIQRERSVLATLRKMATDRGLMVDGEWPMKIVRGDDMTHAHLRTLHDGLLEFRITGNVDRGGVKLREGKRKAMEDRLPEVLEIIEKEMDEHARIAAYWAEQAIVRERKRVVDAENYRSWHQGNELRKALEAQLERWDRARKIREYVAGQRLRLESMGASGRSIAEEWLGWAERHADDIDPLRAEIVTPNVEPLKDWDLPPALRPPRA